MGLARFGDRQPIRINLYPVNTLYNGDNFTIRWNYISGRPFELMHLIALATAARTAA